MYMQVCLQDSDALRSYQIATGICLGIFLLFSLTLLVVLLTYIFSNKHMCGGKSLLTTDFTYACIAVYSKHVLTVPLSHENHGIILLITKPAAIER